MQCRKQHKGIVGEVGFGGVRAGWVTEKHEHGGSTCAIKLMGPGHEQWLATDVLDQP